MIKDDSSKFDDLRGNFDLNLGIEKVEFLGNQSLMLLKFIYFSNLFDTKVIYLLF